MATGYLQAGGIRMTGRRLRSEEVVTLTVLSEKGACNAEIARLLGVTEGMVRYHRTKLCSVFRGAGS
jgi:DNA-binding NarL/FixJ family response regulator